MKNKISKKGFTLIEMLIVIAIIAILSSVFLVGLRGFRSSAYDARRISDLQKIQSYLETIYNANNRKYPDAGNSWSSLQQTLQGAKLGISNVPNDPVGPDYVYCVYSADKQSYILGAKLSTSDNSALGESFHTDSEPNFQMSDYQCTSSIDCGTKSTHTQWLCVKF